MVEFATVNRAVARSNRARGAMTTQEHKSTREVVEEAIDWAKRQSKPSWEKSKFRAEEAIRLSKEKDSRWE